MQQELCDSCANTDSCEAYSSYFGPIMECGTYKNSKEILQKEDIKYEKERNIST